jgi:ADP-ribose pyrophosphatase YjhB (NUDIX family)
MACVERETLEETGLVVRGIRIVGVTNDKFTEADKHYVTLFAKCERVDKEQQPQVRNHGCKAVALEETKMLTMAPLWKADGAKQVPGVALEELAGDQAAGDRWCRAQPAVLASCQPGARQSRH